MPPSAASIARIETTAQRRSSPPAILDHVGAEERKERRKAPSSVRLVFSARYDYLDREVRPSNLTSSRCQNHCFPPQPREESNADGKSPVLVRVAAAATRFGNDLHRVHPVSEFGKRALLASSSSGEITSAIVLSAPNGLRATGQGCSGPGYADAIHGDKSQLDRLQALDAFKDGTTASSSPPTWQARGLDIDDPPYVISTNCPTPEDHVHRIGPHRPRRQQGNAISPVSARGWSISSISKKLIKRPIEQIQK